MIIACENCNKRFEVQDNLIPAKGRLLQCSVCQHQWHFIPENKLKLTQEFKPKTSDIRTTQSIKTKKKIPKEYQSTHEEKDEVIETKDPYKSIKKKKGIGFLSFLFVMIISFVALVILIDTFEHQISFVFPNINLYMTNFYELITDIYLFIKDLIN